MDNINEMSREDKTYLSDDPANRQAERAREHRFWLGLLYAGLAGYGTAIPTILGYVALTWGQPNRGWIIVSQVAALLYALSGYGIRFYVVNSTRFRQPVLVVSALVSIGFFLIVSTLDGGIASPLTYLLIIPFLYIAIGFPIRVVLFCGTLGFAGYAGLVATTPPPIHYSNMLIQIMTLGIGLLLAFLGALNRGRQARAMRELREQIETVASTDALTGCLNQRAFRRELKQEIERSARYGRVMALILVDIDHFKEVNDTHGHLTGDEVLKHVGETLRQAARHSDTAGRIGGDELALLAPETGWKAARVLAERLRQQVSRYDLPLKITLSIGICASIPELDDVTRLFRCADQALYEAKNNGRDQVAVSDESSDLGATHSAQAQYR